MQRCFLFVFLLAVAMSGCGNNDSSHIVVRDAWSPPTPPVTNVAAFYFTIHNLTETADSLVGAFSSSCDEMQIHESVMTGDVSSMAELLEVPIAPDGDVVFAPSGLHLMCLGLTEPVRDGDSIAVILEFERSGSLDIEVVGDDR